MPKKERMAIYEHLFKEGVMVAKKDFHAPKHPELETIENLHVIKAMQVCTSMLRTISNEISHIFSSIINLRTCILESEKSRFREWTIRVASLLLVPD